MKYFLGILAIFLSSTAYSQGWVTVPVGGSRPNDTTYSRQNMRIDSTFRLVKYANTDTNKVLSIDANGMLVFRVKGNSATIDTTASGKYSSKYYVDTAIKNRANVDTSTSTGKYASKYYVDTAISSRSAGGTLQEVLNHGNTATDIAIVSNNNMLADSLKGNTLFSHYGAVFGDSTRKTVDTFIVYGDSYEDGGGTCVTSYNSSWLPQFAARCGAYVINRAIQSTRLCHSSVGDSALMERQPWAGQNYAGRSHVYIFICYTNNDGGGAVSADTVNKYSYAAIDSFVVHGVTPSHIVMTSSGPRLTAIPLLKQYAVFMKANASTLGIQFIDWINEFARADTAVTVCSDKVHMTDYGNRQLFQYTYDKFNYPKPAIIDFNGPVNTYDAINANSYLNVQFPTYNLGSVRYFMPNYNSVGQYNNLQSVYGSASQPNDTFYQRINSTNNNRLDEVWYHRSQKIFGIGHDSTFNVYSKSIFNNTGNLFIQAGGVNTSVMDFEAYSVNTVGQGMYVRFRPLDGQFGDTATWVYSALASNYRMLSLKSGAGGLGYSLWDAYLHSDSIIFNAAVKMAGNFYVGAFSTSGLTITGATSLSASYSNTLLTVTNSSSSSTSFAAYITGNNGLAEPMVIQSNNSTGYSGYRLYDNTSAWAASIYYANSSAANYPGNLVFLTKNSTSWWIFSRNNSTKATIDPNGNMSLASGLKVGTNDTVAGQGFMTSSLITGTGTTATPVFYIKPSSVSAPTTWSTNGTAFGIALDGATTGNAIDVKVGGSSIFSVGNAAVTANELILPGTTGGNTLSFTNSTSDPSASALTPPNNVIGSNSYILTTPAKWILVNISGTDYKIPAY